MTFTSEEIGMIICSLDAFQARNEQQKCSPNSLDIKKEYIEKIKELKLKVYGFERVTVDMLPF